MAGERKGDGLVFASLAVTVVAATTVIFAPLAVAADEFDSVTLSEATTEHAERYEIERVRGAADPLAGTGRLAPVGVTGGAAVAAVGVPALLRRRFALPARLSGSLILWGLSVGAAASVGFFLRPVRHLDVTGWHRLAERSPEDGTA